MKEINELNLETKAKELKSEYHKKWREKNKDRVKEINKRYWINKAKKELEKRNEVQ